jgi:hypothetical protein
MKQFDSSDVIAKSGITQFEVVLKMNAAKAKYLMKHGWLQTSLDSAITRSKNKADKSCRLLVKHVDDNGKAPFIHSDSKIVKEDAKAIQDIDDEIKELLELRRQLHKASVPMLECHCEPGDEPDWPVEID